MRRRRLAMLVRVVDDSFCVSRFLGHLLFWLKVQFGLLLQSRPSCSLPDIWQHAARDLTSVAKIVGCAAFRPVVCP